MRATIGSTVPSLIVLGAWSAFAFAPAAAAAAGSPSPAPAPSAGQQAGDSLVSTDAGTIDGHISSIDYKSGMMTVDVHKKSYDVLVVPGTNISGQKDFHTIADLKKGAHVQVLMSRKGTTNTAQIIRLL